jgi:hypothetical protein
VIISLFIVIALALPMLTLLPEMSQGADFQTNPTTTIIQQVAEDGWELAVNWGSFAPPPTKPFSAPSDAIEVAVNWGSRVPTNSIPLPPPC